ncbi:MAG: acyl-ACP--UDP-N-acetylglucosamine O-acyltransferase [Coxiellaceae bacterium]|jgi:UDP-N-acetylglucosamine acyltransferase|nr:acyl-ACP--UDP-N-acetylglucosamine O-acyltransferase [Coxiellaceae bacterium]
MIDQRAHVVKEAKIATSVRIEPYAVIGPNVEIGEGTWIGSHAVIEGYTKIGKNNQIFQFASIGTIPQDKKYHGEKSFLAIGDNNTFREFCTVNLGTENGGGVTRIGNNNLIMNYVHIAHDCIIGNDIVFSNNASLAGHVIVDDHVIFGGFAKVAQFTRLGAYSFLVANIDLGKDVLPYVIAGGSVDTAKLYGLNVIGLKRHNFPEVTIQKLKDAYNIILRKNLTVQQAIAELKKMVTNCIEIQLFIDILTQSERGILR